MDWPAVSRQSCRQSELYLLMTISVVEISLRQEDKTFGEIGSTCRISAEAQQMESRPGPTANSLGRE